MMQAAYKTYDSYKDSGVPWLGEIPEGWKLLRNKALFKEAKEAVGKKAAEYKLLSLTLKGVIPRDMETPKGKFPAEFNTYKKVSTNDLIFCLFDVEETPRAVGHANEDGMITGAYTVVKVKPELNSRFIHYYYLSLDFDKRLKPLYTGLRNVIKIDTFLGIKMPIPTKDTQDRIVAFLDQKTSEIDAAIAKKQRLIELLKEQKSILINQAVTKGLNPNAPMKDSGIEWIGYIPAHWEVKKVRHLGTLINGISEGADYFGSGHPFVTYGDVYSNFTLPEKLGGLAKASKSACNNYSVKRGDVFFTRTSEIAEEVGISSVCLQTVKNATFSGFVIRFRPFTSLIEPEFSGFYFRSDITRAFFVKEMNLVTRVSLGQNLLKNLPVMIPPQKEQIEISKYLMGALAEIDSVVETSKEQISQLKEFKQTLIAHAVTGKIKV